MKAPGFWAPGRRSLRATVLSPVGAMYGLATAIRLKFKKSWHCPIPVVCVGNLIAGGAGKTPIVIDIAERLRARDVHVHVLSRGYGGIEKGPLRVSRYLYDARLVGDEPLVLSDHAPTWVSDDRPTGCRRAMTEGAGLILMDDGHQDPSCHKNLSIIVVDGGYGFGNGHLIPAGPLRESVASGLGRADAIVVLGEDKAGVEKQVGSRCPVLTASLETGPEASGVEGRNVIAFAGIGNPDKFFDTVRSCSPKSLVTRAFPDHFHYTRKDLQEMRDNASDMDAVLLTTEKDLVRVPPDMAADMLTLPVHVVWRNESEIINLLEPVIDDAI